jgi:SAM-dependent methyltransferase
MLRDVLTRLERGDLPANVALMQLIMYADAPEQVGDAIRASSARSSATPSGLSRMNAVLEIWSQAPDAWSIVKRMLSVQDSGSRTNNPIEYWTKFFDLAAREAADSAAALYALGRADILDAATSEVLTRLREWNVLAGAANVLEIGCGTGRFIAPLAKAGYLAIGIDTSFGMLRSAELRCRGLESTLLVQTGGRDLTMFADSTFDAVLAIDSFPYIVESGRELSEAHIREAARVLRSRGWLVILNYSYRDDPVMDADEIARPAMASDLSIFRSGTRDFVFWDARTHLMRKP